MDLVAKYVSEYPLPPPYFKNFNGDPANLSPPEIPRDKPISFGGILNQEKDSMQYDPQKNYRDTLKW